jgi:predicted membrane protein
MEIQDNNEPPVKTEHEPGHLRSRITGGFLIIAIGALFLARELGVGMPTWLFTWKMLLLAIAFYFAVKHFFKRVIWIVLLLGGIALISDDMFGLHIRPYVWPVLLMALGVYFIFRPRRKTRFGRNWQHRWEKNNSRGMNSSQDIVDVVSFFSGTKSSVISKDFKGGDIVSIFGGAELNLSQADIKGKVLLDITVLFGGANIIVPAHWEVQSEIVSILGGIEDKRPVTEGFIHDQTKVIILSGTAAFGGITIES